MDIRLNRLRMENFKGIKAFEVELEGGNACIKAENGCGKTTIYDAFLWLLFGKNSEGKTDFEIRPLNANNQPIKGLVLAVEADIDVDGTVHTFRKEHHEKVVKKQLRGYETLCTIDEVPKKVGEYNDYIADIIAEDTFKLLTDLTYFNSKLHWTKRREVLLDIAGEIETPDGFEALDDKLNGRTVDEYKQVLAGQKKRYEKERDEINPRIDEIQKGFNGSGYIDKVDTVGIDTERDKIKAEIAGLDEKRKKLFEAEKVRQDKLDLINELEKKKIQREGELKNDVTGIQALLYEKKEIAVYVEQLQLDVFNASSAVGAKRGALKNDKDELEASMKRLSNVRTDYNEASEAPVDDTCYACKQKLPENILAKVEEERKARLAKITKRGNEIKADVDVCKEAIAKYEAEIKEMQEQFEALESKLKKARGKKDKRFAEIEKQIAANETVPPDSDRAWLVFDSCVKKVQAELGEPVAEQLQQLEDAKTELLNSVEKLNQALAHADRRKQDRKRIAELTERESQLAQSVADVEAQLNDIDEYKASQSKLIEQAVNGKFKHVEFKLFDNKLNDSIKETCEATFNGVPFDDMSAGQKIYCGIDIVNVLSAHYGVSVPIFIDHAESLTLPVEADTQAIKLFAVENVKELKIEREGVLQNV